MAESKVLLKLLIDTKGKRVLFAEAGKDFVDFIFHVLALPLATVIRLLGKQEMVGCLGNLYDSIENLSDSYIQVGQNKNILLNPMPPTSVPFLLLNDKPTRKIFYRCGNCYSSSNNVTDDPTAACPNCNHLMNRTLNYVAPPGSVNKGSNEAKGFVKDVVTYMVMDDLMVKPISNISSIALLNKFNVKEMAALQEKEVNFGLDEGLKLLKASLHTTDVLTTVFLSGEDEIKNVTTSRKRVRKH